MWELGIIFGLSFVPVYLFNAAKEIESPIYKTAVYIFNAGFLAMLLRVAREIAELNDAGIAQSVGVMYYGYLAAAIILLALYLIILFKDMKGK